uniref:NADH-ubiquinone oxidoreductase chain 2 n=1 Tax=Petropedetes sp. MVZ 234827 TaxID=1338816 RepID=S4V1S7_9NEOB|nr:NADH dehydrogenase subunit 2 [Petropedetes sp. MVZ 234827]
MNPLALTIFLLSLATGTTVTLLSYHWLLAWIGLEINTLAIIPMMTKTPHPRAIEATTKYFLIQALASALLLFSSLANAYQMGEWTIFSLSQPSSIALFMALATKLGLAPMHFWVPEVLQGVPLSTGFILSTWQKIAPLTVTLQVAQALDLYLVTSLSILSIVIAGWSGINQTQLRKIMAFSSIGHLGWVLVVIKLNPQLSVFTFVVYIITTSATFLTLMKISSTKLSDLSTSWSKSPALTSTLMLSLLSLAGLPPLLGFSPKLFVSLELIKHDAVILTALISLLSLLATFFYLRLTYILTLTLSPNTPSSLTSWRSPTGPTLAVALFNTLALFTFPMSSSLIVLL